MDPISQPGKWGFLFRKNYIFSIHSKGEIMSILDLWEQSKEQVKDKHVQQVISFSGDGQLKDGNVTCDEFRAFLSAIPSELLQKYADQCLNDSFTGSGYALQDVINQVGERLGFEVSYGRYRGSQRYIGNDGLWKFPDGHHLVVEVKTTDAYRIDLNTVMGYRKSLIKEDMISENESSILIVVGRKDTGDLEAQIRGSRFAWDIRLISVDALMRLMFLKQEVEDPRIVKRIYDILIPREFTKLDEIVEILFSTAEDIKEVEPDGDEDETKGPKFHPVSFHDSCVTKIESHLSRTFIKKTRATFTTSDNAIALVCAVSKEHLKGGIPGYWFAFHPHQKEFLEKSEKGFIAFGCGSSDLLALIPATKFFTWLESLNVTKREDRFYWHVILSYDDKKLILRPKKGAEPIDITEYLLK
jgi:hypothetical protein